MRRAIVVLTLAACGQPYWRPGPTDPIAAASLDELAFFQAVEVPVAAGGIAVPGADRRAPLVVGRQAIVRALVQVPDTRTGAELELAVDLTADGVTETFSASDLAEDGIVVEIPARAMARDATYVVRLSAGGELHDRFPETGAAPLDAMVTGPLKLDLVPFAVNGFVPDTSPAIVEGYRAALMATFPVTEVQISVRDVEVWDGPLDLGDINVRVGELQEQAMIAGEVGWDVYWYGMVTGVATREEFTGITGTSEEGGSEEPVRAYFAAGAAFGDQKSEDTLIHEIGHCHRLRHTLCDGEDDPDPDYPYEGGAIGVEGYDFRTGTFVSPDSFDLMSYCFPRWVSDYSYAKLAEHVAGAQHYAGFE